MFRQAGELARKWLADVTAAATLESRHHSQERPLKRARGATSRSDEQQQQCRRPVDLKRGRPFNLWERSVSSSPAASPKILQPTPRMGVKERNQRVKLRAPPVPAVTSRKRGSRRGSRKIKTPAGPARHRHPPCTYRISREHDVNDNGGQTDKRSWEHEQQFRRHRNYMCKKQLQEGIMRTGCRPAPSKSPRLSSVRCSRPTGRRT